MLEKDFSKRYQKVVADAELGEFAHVRGCMVIKPWGYGIWEKIQKKLDVMLKAHGAENAYFPLFIPLDYLEKETKHVSGFAKEMAVVTHKKLIADDNGRLIVADKLEVPLVVRPTSELLVGESMSKWITSYRQLPMRINQWANVVRWEMRPRIFLRSVEFLWQEGHSAYASNEDAEDSVAEMTEIYRKFVEETLCIPVIVGDKPKHERFPGADNTQCIEAMMQDGKALQAGTSHYLGNNFAKASNITFQDTNGTEQLAFTTSYGVSTRLIGGLVMTHMDDNGLKVPPAIAPKHVVILPLTPKKLNDEECGNILDYCESLRQALVEKTFNGEALDVVLEYPQHSTSNLKWSWVKKGIPLIIEVGPRDVKNGKVALIDRRQPSSPEFLELGGVIDSVSDRLNEIQASYFEEAKEYRERQSKSVVSLKELLAFFEDGNGFVWGFWGGNEGLLEVLDEHAITVRCIVKMDAPEEGKCIFTQEQTSKLCVFARSY